MFEKTLDENFILSYLQQIKLESCKSIEQFWNNIYKKYAKETVDNLRDIVTERNLEASDGDKLYTLKNQTLELSLDFSSYSTELYRKFFEWFIQRGNLKTKTILDLGCDNGITTCFFAKLFPEAEVIGIDINESAISCANRLKKYLNVHNVDFRVMDIKELHQHFEIETFDMIVSIRTLHEVIEIPDFPYWSISDMPLDTLEQNPILCSISNLLKSNGEFISWERLSDTTILYWWIQQLNKCNLYVDLTSSAKIEFSEVGIEQVMPAIVSKSTTGPLPTSIDILAFGAGQSLIDFNTIKEYEDDSAELTFSSCEPKELLYGFQINYANDLGNLRHEVWSWKGFLLEYIYSNIGDRELIVYPISDSDTLKCKMVRIENLQIAMGKELLHYDSAEERDSYQL